MATVAQPRRRLLPRTRFSPALGWKAWALRHAWFAPVLLVAVWLRVTGLTSSFLYGDEAEYAIVARYLSRDFTFLAYPALEGFAPTPFVSQPPLILYMMAVSMKVLGPTDLAAILPSVVLGVGTVVAVYALGNRLGGRFMGLGAAALLAVLPFHIEMSRKAMLDAGYTFFLVLTAYFLVAWLQTSTRKHAVMVGVAAACAALSKLPGMLAGFAVLGILLVAVVLMAVRRARGAEWKETGIQAGLGVLPVAVGAGLYVGFLMYLQSLSSLWAKLQWQLGRVDQDYAAVREATAVARPAEFYFTDSSFSFQAMIGGLVFGLALVGLIVALLRFVTAPQKRTAHLVVPAMVGVLLAFFLYSERKEGFYLLPFAPFAALLVAEAASGLRDMLRWAGIRVSALAPRAAPIAVVGGLLLVAVPAYGAAVESYEDFALGQTQQQYFGYGTKEAARYIQAQDPNAAQYGTLLGRFTLHWYNEQPAYHWYMDHTYLEGQVSNGKLKYIVYDEYLDLAFDEQYMRELIQKYNGELVQTYRAGWGEVKVFELHP